MASENHFQICPLSLETFTHPIILPTCGHTFDKPALDKLLKKECPICVTPFSRTDIVNWAIAQSLSLTIPKDNSAKRAQKSQELAKKHYAAKAVELYNKIILPSIDKFAKEGYLSLSAMITKDQMPDSAANMESLKNEIMPLILADGYKAYVHIDVVNKTLKINITWS